MVLIVWIELVLISFDDLVAIELEMVKKLNIERNGPKHNAVAKIFLDWYVAQEEVKDEKSTD